MITLITCLIINVLIFIILRLFLNLDGFWWWYLSVTLAMVRLYCQAIYIRYQGLAKSIIKNHKDIFDDEDDKVFFKLNAGIYLPPFELISFFARVEFASAITYASLGSVIYSIICGFLQQWGPCIFSALVFVSVPLFNIGNAFYGTEKDNMRNAIQRYIRSMKHSVKKATDIELRFHMLRYEAVQSKLTRLYGKD